MCQRQYRLQTTETVQGLERGKTDLRKQEVKAGEIPVALGILPAMIRPQGPSRSAETSGIKKTQHGSEKPTP